jgi:hypothetical protein
MRSYIRPPLKPNLAKDALAERRADASHWLFDTVLLADHAACFDRSAAGRNCDRSADRRKSKWTPRDGGAPVLSPGGGRRPLDAHESAPGFALKRAVIESWRVFCWSPTKGLNVLKFPFRAVTPICVGPKFGLELVALHLPLARTSLPTAIIRVSYN